MVMGYRFPVTELMEQDWYDRLARDQGSKRASFGIEDAVDDALVGFVHISDIDWHCRSAEFGVVIGDTKRQNQGLGREATALAVSYAFQTLNLERLTVRYLATNTASDRMFRSLGFVPEGRLRQAGYVNGAPVDVVVAGLLRGEFLPAMKLEPDAMGKAGQQIL